MKYLHTMPKIKITVALDDESVRELDRLVEMAAYPSRSQAVQASVDEKLARLARTRLAREVEKLDPAAERALAEEGLSEELDTWPEY